MVLRKRGSKNAHHKRKANNMKARYTAQKTATFTPETARRIEQAAEQLNMSVVQVIRECVENDLPKLLDREKARRRRRRA